MHKPSKKEPSFHFKPHTDSVHIWNATASPLIQRCERGCCQATRYYRDGAWSEPYTEKPALPTAPVAEQASLW